MLLAPLIDTLPL